MTTTRSWAPPTCTQQSDPTLQRARAWEYGLPQDALIRGTQPQNNLTRLRHALQPALRGEPLVVMVLGGSVTGGTGAAAGSGYVQRFFNFINSVFLPTNGRTNDLHMFTGATSAVLETWYVCVRGRCSCHARCYASHPVLLVLVAAPKLASI